MNLIILILVFLAVASLITALGWRIFGADRFGIGWGYGIAFILMAGFVYWAQHLENSEAVALGFASASDRKSAEMAGIAADKWGALSSDQKHSALVEAEKAKEDLAQKAEAECLKSASCWYGEHGPRARGDCAYQIEQQARFQMKWTSSMTTPRFEGFSDGGPGVARVWGRAAQFQNGFGAWQRMAYHCDFEMKTQRLVNVSVRPLNQ